jgi:hypothetical protein
MFKNFNYNFFKTSKQMSNVSILEMEILKQLVTKL